MVMEMRTYFRRLVSVGVGFLGAALMLGGAARGQAPAVSTGSIVNIPFSTTWGQIYVIRFYKGNVLALDSGAGALYQLSPGATSWTTLSSASSSSPLGTGGYNTIGMAIDAVGNLYLGIRYPVAAAPSALFWRIPYDSAKNTWDVTTSYAWGSNIIDPNSGATVVSEGGSDWVDFVNSSKMDGSGTLYWVTENPNEIYTAPVDASGNADLPNGVNANSIVTGLETDGDYLAEDVSGNIYLVENHAVKPAARVPGIYFIPAGTSGIVGSEGSAEAQLIRIDSSSNPVVYAGITLDAYGNIYVPSEVNSSYGETVAGIWKIPNECGSAAAVNSSCLPNFNDISLYAPVSSNNPVSIDSRGYVWIPTYQDWSPNGSGPYPNLYAIAVWAPGSINLGAAPTGAAGPAGKLFIDFNQPITPGGIQFSQPGTGSDFTIATTDPTPPTTAPATSPACTSGTAYSVQNICQVWVALDARKPGAISGQLMLLNSSNSPVAGSTVYLSGIGQGSEASLLSLAAQSTVAAGLDTPAQVAADAVGDTWVADAGLHQVLKFSAGSTTAVGAPVGKNLVAPTGVAVDGSGDLYIADSGKVIEIPWVNGALDTAGQTTLATGFGSDLNLAADGVGNVYVADPKNSRVVKIPSPETAQLYPDFETIPATSLSTTVTMGSGFSAPSAIATDNSGDLFVADGANLYEITPWDVQTELLNSLTGPVTGLAVDASGSVDVAQSGGVLHIPAIAGVLSFNSASSLDDSVIAAPNGVALDQEGNLYVTDMTSGTPNLFELSANGFVNFGVGLTPTVLAEEDVPVFNIGNENLTVTGTPTFSGPDASDFSVTTPSGGTPCDTTGATPVAAGNACTIGAGFTPPPPPAGDILPITYSGDTMTIPTNAGNVAGGDVSAGLEGSALAGLEATQATVSLNPATTTFPGSTAVTVTITPEPGGGIDYPTNVPSGTVTLTLTSTVAGSTQPPLVETAQAAGNDTGTTATFTLTGILGGTYNVTAAYGGNLAQLFQKSQSSPVPLTVSPAAPTISLPEPTGVQPNSQNGVYYVLLHGDTTLTANVASTLGTPTGLVTFMNGTTAVGTAAPDANGNASLNLGTLVAGNYTVTAVYSGDQNFASVTSQSVSFQVIPASVLIWANPTSVSTKGGTPVSSTLSLESLVGFTATNGANITCDNSTMPNDAECTFSVPQPDICAPTGQAGNTCSGITTTVVTISTNIPVNIGSTQQNRSRTSPLVLAGIFGLGLLGLGLRRRATFNRYLFGAISLVLFLTGAVLGVSSCTNSGYTKTPAVPTYTTPTGTYNVSIIVTNPGNGTQESLPFTLGVTIQ